MLNNARTFFREIVWRLIMDMPVTPQTNSIKLKYLVRQGYSAKDSSNYLINRFLHIKGNVHLGDAISINRNVMIVSSRNVPITIGDHCLIGPNVVIRNANHGFSKLDKPIRYQEKTALEIKIGNNVWIAANCVILGGVIIGDGSIVAAGSVLTKGDYPPNYIIGGVPARVIKSKIGEMND
jgi:acetyltransferase-like isoleucine patch superfamily enzyme